jgi:hypothetical protein
VRTVDSSGTRLYVCDGAEPGSGVLSDGSAVYTPGISERRGGVSKEYHGDALGSTRGITNASQTVIGTIAYEGFGQSVGTTGKQ